MDLTLDGVLDHVQVVKRHTAFCFKEIIAYFMLKLFNGLFGLSADDILDIWLKDDSLGQTPAGTDISRF